VPWGVEPSSAYLALMESIRTIWQLSLNLEAAARHLLLHRGLHGTASEVNDPVPHARLFLPIVEAAWKQNHRILRECIDVLDADVVIWDDTLQLAEVRKLSEELERHANEATNPPLSAVLYNLMQLSGETICLRKKVQRLLMTERPKSFDD
jgi:hypothetical protein